MAKKNKKEQETPVEETVETTETVEETVEETPEAVVEVNPWEEKYNAERDAHLRVAAEFDNFRKRTVKEKEASYGNGKADAVAKLLPVYDNLERALNQTTEDESLGENTISMVFQKGFRMGDKIVRFAMVQVAN